MRYLPLRSLFFGLVGLAGLTVTACGGGSVDDAQQAIDQAGLSSSASAVLPVANGDPQCEAMAALPTQSGNLAGWLQSAHINKGEYVAPSPENLSAFQSAFENLLRDGATQASVQSFDAMGFSLGGYADDGGTFWLVLEEKAPRKGGGTYVINPAASREMWLEAPHADSDSGTLQQAAEQLVTLGARALLITGANRCASSQASPCTGTTAKCEGTLRVSDAAHSEDSFFMSAHKALRAVHPNGLAVNLHGMESTGLEAAVISDGTKGANPGSVSNALRTALNGKLTGTAKAFSCNDPSDAGYRDLCGTNNVQGRFDNGASNVCTTGATSATGKFIHLEQDSNLRGGGEGGKALIDAFAEVVTCTSGGQGGQGCGNVAPLCQ